VVCPARELAAAAAQEAPEGAAVATEPPVPGRGIGLSLGCVLGRAVVRDVSRACSIWGSVPC
jgi:hypothetical protein